MTQSERGHHIPADSFRIRLAIVRTEMGWNYDQAQAATGVGSESWRQWEKALRNCTDVIGVSKKIAEATGYDQAWLALGGSLMPDDSGSVAPTARTSRGAAAARSVGNPVRSGHTFEKTGEYTALARARRSLSVNCPSLAGV